MTEHETAESSRADVTWLTPNPLTGDIPVFVKSDDSPWHVIPHWAMVDGRAVLVGIDIRSFVTDWIPDPSLPSGGYEGMRSPVNPETGFAEVTQQVLRSVSIAQVRRETSDHIAATLIRFFGDLVDRQPQYPIVRTAAEIAAQLTESGRPRMRRPPSSDDLLRRVGVFYNEAVRRGSKTPVKDTQESLHASGEAISTRGGSAQVRKWVQRARQKGYIPPA